MHRPSGEAELVELDEGRGTRRSERTALELAVGRAERLRIPAAKDDGSGARRSDELREGNAESHGDLPEDPHRGVALARLDLRQRRPAHARRTREVIQRQPAALASLAEVVGDTPPELRGPDVVAVAGAGPIRLAHRCSLLHYHGRLVENTRIRE
jgi:hypothetical protein